MSANTVYIIALFVSLLWFLAGFRYFSFQSETAAKVLVPKSARSSPLFPTIAAATRFLGGFNAAFAALCLILLVCALSGAEMFSDARERAALLVVVALAHFSQFIFNVPVLKNGERQGESFWPVMSGPMRFIFFMDAAQTVLCLAAAIIQFS